MHSQEVGDIIGVESSTEFSPNVEDIIVSRHERKSRTRWSTAAEMEYPPPIAIPLLENLMKKHRTSDGRLVITEERAPRQEYFQVHRSNGRLVLYLIPLNNVNAVMEEERLGLPGNVADSGGSTPPEAVYIGVHEPCSGFGVAMAGLAPPVTF